MHTWSEQDGAGALHAVVIGVAIAIPHPYGEELTRWRQHFGDPLARNVPPHVTLLPPTEIEPGMLPEIRRHLTAVAAGERSFHIRLRGTGTFRPVSPVVFVQLSEGIAECEQLEQRVRTGVLARQLKFYYHPHVTVAHHLEDDALDRAFDTLADYHVRFHVDSFELFEHGADDVWRPSKRFWFDGVAGFPGGSGTTR